MYFIKTLTYQNGKYPLIPIDEHIVEEGVITLTSNNYYQICNIKKEPIDSRILEYFKVWYQYNSSQRRNLILKDGKGKYYLIDKMQWDKTPIIDNDFYSVSFYYESLIDISNFFKRSKIVNEIR